MDLKFQFFLLKNFLDNDPRQAITFAGVLLLISAFCTLLIKTKKSVKEKEEEIINQEV